MNIDRIGFDGKAVVILGAGATRGAEFVSKSRGALPPLDKDFFTQAQRLSTAKPKELIEKLIKDVVTTFGNNFALTMEGYLTRLEQNKQILALLCAFLRIATSEELAALDSSSDFGSEGCGFESLQARY